MAIASVAIFLAAPWLGRGRRRGLRRRDPGAVRRAAPDQLPRPGPVRRLDRARRGPRRPPPVPVLRARPDPLHGRDHRLHGALREPVRDRRHGLGRGRRRRRPPRDPGDRHDPDDVPDPARASPSGRAAFREFLRLMLPRMLGHPIEPLTITYFTSAGDRARRRRSVTSLNFASDYQVVPVSLIGVVVLAGGLPGPVGGLRRRRRRRRSGRSSAGTS